MDNIVFAEQADAVYMTESETQQTEEAEEEERKTVDYTEIESESSIEINTENYTEIISEIETESLLTTASTTEIETQEESDTEKTVIEESGTNDSEICDTEPIAESEIQTTTEIETETMSEIKEKDKRRTTKATGKDITRIEWLNALTNTFEMTVEENNYPDNYFSDISPDSSYYHNVMLAAEFGLIDVEAGEAFCPDADATREFAVHTLNLCLQYAPLSENYTFAESETVLYPEDIQVAVELEWFELDTDNRFYPEQTLKESEKDFLIELAQEEVLSQKVDSNYHNSFHFKEGVIVLPEGVNAALTNDDEITLTDCDIEIKEGDIFGLVVSGFPFAKKAQNIDIEGNKQIISVSEVSQEEAFQEIDVQGSSDISLTSIQMADEENIRLFYIVGGTRERNWTDGQKYEKLVGISESEITAVEIVKTYELSPKQRAQFEIADGVNAQITCTIENIDVDWKDSFTECMVLLNSDVRFHFNLSIDVFQALGVKPSIEVARVPVLLFGYASISASLDLSGSVTLDMVEYTSLGIKYMKHNRFGDRFRFVKEFRKKSFTIQAKTKLTITLTLMFGFDLGFMNGNLNGDWGATVTVDTKTFNDGEVPNTCMHVESWMFVNTGGYVKVKHLLQKDELWDYRNEIYTKLNSPVKVSFHYEDGQAVDRCTRDKTGTRYKYYSPADSRYGYNGGSGGIGSNGEPYTIFEYSLDEYENATITSYNGNVSALSIPQVLDGYTVIGIERGVFKDNNLLSVVVIPDHVEEIGDEAFMDCKNLSIVKLPKSLKKMGKGVFNNCDAITEIEIPKSLKDNNHYDSGYRYGGPFKDCDGLKKVVFEQGTTKIARYLLDGCTGIEEIEIPDTVTIIEHMSFYNCANLSKVTIPDSVKTIESSAFENCPKLNRIEIPDSVEEIENDAFSDCLKLSDVKLSKNLKKMGAGVFNNCDAITEIEIPKSLKDNDNYDSGYGYGGPFKDCDGLKKVVFEQGTTKIARYLLDGCTGIEEIEIPDTVTIIEHMSFYNCANLSKVTIPDSVKTIESSAFENCPKLNRIEIPDSVEEIENDAFSDCLKLSDVKLSKNLKKMGAGVFNNCDAITEIEIPKSLKDNDNYDSGYGYGGPFKDCDGLKKVVFEQGTTKIARYLLDGCTGIEEIEIPDTVTIIEHMSFYKCANLSKVTIPASVKTIESSAFENCPKLQKIEIPDSVTILENSIFEGCSNLKEVILPKEIVNIPDCTFKDCVRLEKINFPVSLESIKEYAFYQTNLKEVSFPDKLKSLEDYVFYNCDSLTVVTMNSGLIEIGDYVFYDCDSLTEMAIPDSVTSFGKSAFSECELLSDVTLGTGITVIPTNAFHLCPSLEKMILPYRTAEIKANAFTNCTKLTEITIPRSVTTIADSVFSYPGKLTIYGISGTYAETYANQIGAAFVNREVSAADVTLNTTELTMLNGAKYAMILSVIPMDFTDEVTWQSSNPDIVVIDKDGMLTAKAVGTANVRVAVGEKTAVCAVTVVQPVTRISLNKSSLALEAFEEYALTATVYPSDAADKSIEWTSSDDSVAMISQTGLVTPVSKGTAVITAKAKDGSGKYGSCEITVMSDGQLCTKYIDLESEHNYANNMNKVWKYQYSGAKTLDVTFDEQTAIDEYGDFIYLYDGEDNELQKATGTSLAGQTIHVTGDTVKIKLVSDKAVTAWGFRVSKLVVDGKEMNPDDETPVEKPVNIFTVTYDMQGHGGQIPPAEVKSGEKLIKPSDPAAEDYIFKGWYKEKACFNKWDFENDTVTAHMTLYAHWIEENPTEEPSTEQPSEEPTTEAPSEDSTDTEDQGDGLWISGISKTGYTYTGEAIKPAISVYDKTTLLTEKTDYSITYKNNTKAGTATVIVTGRGNYSGKETVSFDILPADIGSQEVHAMDFYVKIGKKAQKPVPELYYMGAKLKNNKDFTISYSNATNIYLQPGEYNATISGKGNYTGTRTIKLTAVEKLVKPKPVSITKATINGLQKTFIYTGKACKQACILTINTSEGQKNLTEGVDYIVKYINNTKAGTASVTYYGKNGYTGKVKKTYKILPYNILEDSNAKIKYDNHFECVYAKGGSKPKPVVTFDGKALKEGTDYTLSYKNNKAVSGSQTPCVVVNGKGCFKGKIPIYFTITAQDLSQMMLVSGDKLYKPKADIYRITPKLMDLDSKLLSAGKDFDKKSITYVYENDVLLENGMSKSAGSAVESTDIIPSDTQIRITLDCGTGSNYKGRFSGIYRIVKADIKSAKVTIPKQIYTGKEIVLDKSQITVKYSGVILKPDEFEIVRYDNNIKKGKASVTLRGTGNYGGIKTVKFDIGTKGLLWWWKK